MMMMMMRWAKDEEKMTRPLFPRIHVNDTEKGGPRPPPRNKMALYEQQLRMPSSHVGGVFTPFCDSPAPAHPHSDKSFSFSCSCGVKLSSNVESQEQKSMDCTNDQGSNTNMQPLSSSAKSNSSSPDALKRVIGDKKFWKARRHMINQQREFTAQVFELHRLIEVQKLLARSPELLLECKISSEKASSKASQAKRVPFEYGAEYTDENAVASLLLPCATNGSSKRIHSLRSNDESHSGDAPVTPIVANTRTSPWYFPPPGNQWIVPVMSPSEGLVYKPYTGPCPLTAGFMSPVYGNCAPMNIAYGVSFLPAYGVLVMNSSVSVSAGERVRPFIGLQSKDNQLPIGDFNFTLPSQSSSNMPDQNGQSNEQRTRVIKVVPHNPRLATESAAGIFQTIQEERKQYD